MARLQKELSIEYWTALKNKAHLIFLAQSIEQPRVIKRVFQESEHQKVKVFGFRRKIHQVKNFSVFDNSPNIEYHIVGTIQDEKFVTRIWQYIRLLLLVLIHTPFRRKTIYSFGLDLRIISSLIPFSDQIYEISDIVWLYRSGFKRRLLRKIDYILCLLSNKVVFTSLGFYNTHYKFLLSDKVIIKENKLQTYGKVAPILELRNDKISVAYIGAFRYRQIIEILTKVIANLPHIELHFYGDGPSTVINSISNISEKHANISYHGPFKNPDDLASIYHNNNINFVVYDNKKENEQVAMPNKFYESGFFNIPIVGATNTYVGERIVNLGMGWKVDPNEKDLKSFFESLTIEEVQEVHYKIKSLDKGCFQEDVNCFNNGE